MPKNKVKWHSQKLQASAKRNKYAGIPGSNSGIANDDFGVFVTCDKGREGKSSAELIELLEKAAIELGYIDPTENDDGRENGEAIDDIEASIAAEIEGMKPGKREPGKGHKTLPFRAVKLDIPCVSFIKFVPPMLDPSTPVKFVHHICCMALTSSKSSNDSSYESIPQQSRYIRRLTPITLVRKTLNPGGLDSLCERVLTPYFRPSSSTTPQESTSEAKKFAIRPTVRNNDTLNRDVVIKTVAEWISASETSHPKINSNDSDPNETTKEVEADLDNSGAPKKNKFTVDLKNWNLLVVVEVYRNVVGMSVLTSRSYDEDLRRYNLAEIYHPTSSSAAAAGGTSKAKTSDTAATVTES